MIKIIDFKSGLMKNEIFLKKSMRETTSGLVYLMMADHVNLSDDKHILLEALLDEEDHECWLTPYGEWNTKCRELFDVDTAIFNTMMRVFSAHAHCIHLQIRQN